MRMYVIQANYGPPHYWEDLTAETTKSEAEDRLDEYADAEPGIPHRLISRRHTEPEMLPDTGAWDGTDIISDADSGL